MYTSWRLLIALSFIAFWQVSICDFAYSPGNCEVSISKLIREIVHRELFAVFNPKFRYTQEKLIRFDLYTKKNPTKRQILETGDSYKLRRSNFNRNWPVRFSIHGWMGNSLTCSNAAVKDAYLFRGDFNVIIVDWSAHAVDINYTRISGQLSAYAHHLVKFIDFLQRETGVAYQQIYLIGHSAGAHIAGWVGKILRPARLGAIIALDPAGLAQLALNETHRLAPTDALYVESLHTDIQVLGNPNTNLSQATFFANWGLGQPHCPNATAAEFGFVCDHFAALYYFAESVRDSKLFGALSCEVRSKALMNADNCICRGIVDNACEAVVYFGGEPLTRKSGVFYFSTMNKPPFGYGKRVYKRPPQPSNILKKKMAYNKETYFRKVFLKEFEGVSYLKFITRYCEEESKLELLYLILCFTYKKEFVTYLLLIILLNRCSIKFNGLTIKRNKCFC